MLFEVAIRLMWSLCPIIGDSSFRATVSAYQVAVYRLCFIGKASKAGETFEACLAREFSLDPFKVLTEIFGFAGYFTSTDTLLVASPATHRYVFWLVSGANVLQS